MHSRTFYNISPVSSGRATRCCRGSPVGVNNLATDDDGRRERRTHTHTHRTSADQLNSNRDLRVSIQSSRRTLLDNERLGVENVFRSSTISWRWQMLIFTVASSVSSATWEWLEREWYIACGAPANTRKFRLLRQQLHYCR